MNLLIVHYLPRGERSRTRRLLDAVRAETSGVDVEELDLAARPPAAFDSTSLPAYVRRNYVGEALSATESSALHEADRLTAQLLAADAVVLAFPMFNFSVPAAVKAWMDAVMQKGRTWAAPGDRSRSSRALILMTAGARYDGARADWDHAMPLARHAFEFMGFKEIHSVRADGLNVDPATSVQQLQRAEHEARRIAREWLAATAAIQ